MEYPVCSESITDNITVDENENEDSLGKIVSSALIGLVAMKFKQYTKFDKYDDQNLEFGVKIMHDRIRVNNDNLFFGVFMYLE